MQQQINLFQPIFRKERKIFSFGALIQISLTIVVALAILYGYGSWQNTALKKDIAGMKKRHDERIGMLERLSREVAKHDSENTPQKEIARLEAELAAERYIVSLLGQDKHGTALGFSEYLEIFSRRVVQGMWISQFTVLDGGAHMLIKGGALSAELLPGFLQGLSEEPELQGLEFTVLQMAREEPKRAWIEFILSSKELDDSLFKSDR